MKYINIIILFTILLNVAYAADIEVNIKGIEENEGVIRAGLFSSAIKYAFPVPSNGIQQTVKANTNGVSLKFSNVSAGEYAISVLHDKNNNNEMDTVIGIPSEPYGNSGEYTSFKPDYEESKFIVTDKSIVIEIIVH
jgi:uncharacterized protein (DUF2141 family)